MYRTIQHFKQGQVTVMLKDKILNEFEQNLGKTISGQFLADEFKVSRNAVWKAINSLKTAGYQIESIPQKGYMLARKNDIITKDGILSLLDEKTRENTDVLVFDVLDSTNNEAKRMLAEHEAGNTIIVAKEQTNGRGRSGHSFFSPANTGIYMSIILKPDLPLKQSLLLTTAAAVAVMRAVRYLTDKQLEIKWVNDLFYNGKKVCGILTEAVTDFESGKVSNVIIGIGMNITTKAFSADLENIAGSIGETQITKNEFISSIYQEILYICQNINESFVLEEYKKCSMLLGKEITITECEKNKTVKVIDIAKDGALIVLDDNADTKEIRSGEIFFNYSIDKTE